ncbi:TraR/DksA family transcriptional regulator [Limibaculum sp. FT325]|uniref:TraR/DksA family transcriptional regulator n=1 Tax=Thermohalobaculum sediminis TaxID=2939436 RepID=UPI0020BEF539|nr:TraR/DksA C4-type zinc finger protein [Limibaculum sediminis]MCL5777368.1 TraR/DksA family transcriptional regulator [Limibaculum sediminis]
MDDRTAHGFREKLEAMRAALAAEEAATESDRAPVELDQQSVGRLSRMDAMQVQAMALGQSRRRAAQMKRIDAALARIEGGDFGWCLDCGEEIGLRRLQLDPAAPYCVHCAGTR